MATMSKVFMIGRLTADPEAKDTSTGKRVCNFTLAVDRRFQKDETDFFNASAWGKTADFIADNFNKGEQILIFGPMQTRTFTRTDGTKQTIVEIFVDEADFVDRKKTPQEPERKYEPVIPGLGETRSARKNTAPQTAQDVFTGTPDEDLPF